MYTSVRLLTVMLRATPSRIEALTDSKVTKVEGEGRWEIECYDEDGVQRKMQLNSALYTPTLARNLLSVSALNQATGVLNSSSCQIKRGDVTV